LTDRVVITLPNSGHGATLQSPCGQGILFAFLTDPVAAPDVSCVAEVATAYVTPSMFARVPIPSPAAIDAELSLVPRPFGSVVRKSVRRSVRR
jgi:hypothetical protein